MKIPSFDGDWVHFLGVLIILSAMIAYALKRPWFNALLDSFAKFVEWIYRIEAGPRLWIAAFLSITFMRDFWENFIEHAGRVYGLAVHLQNSLMWFVYFFLWPYSCILYQAKKCPEFQG